MHAVVRSMIHYRAIFVVAQNIATVMRIKLSTVLSLAKHKCISYLAIVV